MKRAEIECEKLFIIRHDPYSLREITVWRSVNAMSGHREWERGLTE